MAINFPDNPSNGDTYQGYTYNSTKNTWTPATSPAAVVEYATVDLLPGTADTGDMALVTATNRLYIWNGSGWYNIALINTTPSISGVNSSYVLASDGTATTITITATDPEGLPITYSIASDTSGNIATVTQGTGASSNVFTITPSTNSAYAGSFTLTFRASDGVNIATAPATFTLQFLVQNSNYTAALITTNGSTGGNSTITDSSSSSHSITVGGNTTQQSFSPYRSGGYSYYFDGNGDTLTVGDPFGFGTNDFTVEFWYNPSVQYSSSVHAKLMGGEVSGSGNTWGVGFTNYNGTNGMIFGVGLYGSYTGGRYVNGYWGTKGQWDHIVWQRNSGTIECYINGTSQTLSTMQQNFTWSDSIDIANNKNLTVGSDGSGQWYTGYMKELKITNGSAVYTSGVTVPTEEISLGSEDFLGLHLPYLKDSSSNDHSITPAGDVTAAGFGPYEYTEYAVGDNGGSIYLDGSGDFLEVPHSSDLSLGPSTTIQFWLYIGNGSETNAGIIGKWEAASTNNRQYILYKAGADINFYWSTDGSTFSYSTLTTFTNIKNKWSHFAITYDNTTLKVYLNGKQVTTQTVSIASSPSDSTNIGRNGEGDASYMEGYISDLKISTEIVYTTDFTPPTSPLSLDTNTKLLLNGQGAVIRDKAQASNLTLAGNTTGSTAQYKYLPSSMYFDGTGDYIATSLNNDFSSKSYTIEGWFYPSINLTGRYSLFNIGSGTSATDRITIGVYDGTFFHQHEVGNSNTITVLSGGIGNYTLTSGQWHHFEMVFDWGGAYDSTSTGYIFMNGVLQETYRLSAHVATSIVELSRSDIAGGAKYFPGYISDFRVRQGIAAHTANFTPPTAALQG